MSPYPAPVGATARRIQWGFLPPVVRRAVEQRCGSPVVEAHSQDSGFTPGMASVLVCADGSRHFVKAAAAVAQRAFAESYREEARKLAALPASVPAPRLLWTDEVADWVLLGIEHVEARHPHRPWTAADLEVCLDAVLRAGEVLTPPPAGLALDPIARDLADLPGHWDHLLATHDLPHGAEAAALAADFARWTGGSTVVHTDLRDDNLLIAGAPGAERALVCDWNWPVVGAAWVDPWMLLVGPRGDGVDVDAVVASHPVLAEAPREGVDALLALLTGYFLRSGDLPSPRTSPHMRAHQRWQGEVCWAWLCERRGWA